MTITVEKLDGKKKEEGTKEKAAEEEKKDEESMDTSFSKKFTGKAYKMFSTLKMPW